MSTPNPDHDPDWQVKWRAAQFRVESVGRQDNISDMWTELEKRFVTLEDYHVAIIDRIRSEFPDVRLDEDFFPFDPTMSPEDVRTKWGVFRQTFQKIAWESSVRERGRHRQPEGLSVFAEPIAAGAERLIQCVRWGGLHGRRMGISETVAIRELYATEAHVCFISAPSVTCGTYPAVDDIHGRVQLPTVYFRTQLADRYAPDQVRWYHYQSADGSFEHVWFFRQARLDWQPAREERFLWRRKNVPGDWFVRTQSSSSDKHFESVPRIIGESILASVGDLPIVDLPDFRGDFGGC